MKTLIRLLREEKGVTAVEYGLIAMLISVAAVTAMKGAGTQITALFNTVKTDLTPAR